MINSPAVSLARAIGALDVYTSNLIQPRDGGTLAGEVYSRANASMQNLMQGTFCPRAEAAAWSTVLGHVYEAMAVPGLSNRQHMTMRIIANVIREDIGPEITAMARA